MTLGIDVGGTKVLAALVEGARVVRSLEEPTDKGGLLNQLIRLVRALGGTSVGVGVAGQVKEGVVLFAPNLGLCDYPLQTLLEAELGIPVRVANDVQAGARGELLFGAAQEGRSLLVQLGTGIGGALVERGRVLEGTAGEVGHMVIAQEGLPCHCGRRGCWEAYVGGWAGRLDYPSLVTGLANLVNLFNPDRIILGGGRLKAYDQSHLQRDVEQEALPAARPFTLIASSLPNVIGCAHMAEAKSGREGHLG